MHIQQRRIMNITERLSVLPSDTELKVSVQVDTKILKLMPKLGFSEKPSNGEVCLPAIIGPISRFNADGKWLVYKNQPKQARYLHTVWWTWQQWSGAGETEEQQDSRDVYRDCYPRELIDPPALELAYLEYQGISRLVTTKSFSNKAEEHQLIRHAINLFLELFGECEIVYGDLSTIILTDKIQRLNWKVLPQGEYPWERLEQHLRETLKERSLSRIIPILDRQKTIYSYKPTLVCVGLGGFSDYLAYVFEDKGMVVLESLYKGNALYLLGSNWRSVSQLTKAEIINKNYHLGRIIHTKGWQDKLKSLLNQPNFQEDIDFLRKILDSEDETSQQLG